MSEPAENLYHDPLRRRARRHSAPPRQVVRAWLSAGWADLKTHFAISMVYGFALAITGWAVAIGFAKIGHGWAILPMISGGMLLGPVATVGLYRLARKRAGFGDGIIAPGQIFLVSVVMMVLTLMWVRAATILFAVFFGLRPFAGFFETLWTMLTTPQGILLFFIGSAVGGLFAALGFAISAFSFPMLVHRDIDGFSAMALSYNATIRNFRLMLTWGVAITALTTLAVASGLILLIPIFPLLGFATWHAYCDLFESEPHAK